MLKKANNNEFFAKLVEAATAVKPKEQKSDFSSQVAEMLKTAAKKPTLLDVLKQAQMLEEPMAPAAPAEDVAPVDPALPVEEETEHVFDEGGQDETKKLMAQAFLALHGGDVEAAKACLDECGGGEVAPEVGGEIGGEDELPVDPAVGADLNASPIEEMPKDMMM
jgi:hypothetical protein